MQKVPLSPCPYPLKNLGGGVVCENNYKKSSSSERRWREATDRGQKQPCKCNFM